MIVRELFAGAIGVALLCLIVQLAHIRRKTTKVR